MTEMEYIGTATYSPEDNKIRIYPNERLDSETYQKVKAAGFKWAPKQELFVAPMWTPDREDLAIELCGDIGDEDTSLVDRAEERAERFEEYSDKREKEAYQASESVKQLTDNIPIGQPILIGHHSEKRARKDAKRIENGMRKAVKLWETSKYWEDRAKGAISHAKYKELPTVRARRIKKLEADLRKQEKEKKEAEQFIRLWESIDSESILKFKEGEQTPERRALWIANRDHVYKCFTLTEYPRKYPASQYEGSMSLWSALTDGVCTAYQAQEIALKVHARNIKRHERWITHLTNRLTYEKAMLNEAGAGALIEKKPRPKQLPLCNYRAPEGIQIENPYHRGEFETYPQVEMTKAEYGKIPKDYKMVQTAENSHRIRTTLKMYIPGYIPSQENDRWHRVCVFLTDQKVTEKPDPIEKQQVAPIIKTRPVYKPPARTEFDDLKDTLKEGIKTVSAPQLFPTPEPIAVKMVELAEIEPGHDVLEPSAGTGNLLKSLPCIRPNGSVTAIEINQNLKPYLEPWADNITIDDFLNCHEIGNFDRIIMNPPFSKASDIKHIKHAMTFLKPGGRLVALCANGPRQNEQLRPLADHWEVLPEGSFKQAGTNVNIALMVINN